MDEVQSPPELPFARQKNAIFLLLGFLSAAAWGVLVWQSSLPAEGLMGLGVTVFLGLWVVMMVAMMFPAAAPMIAMFSRIYAHQKKQGKPFVPVWIFVAGYVAVWTLFGIVAFALSAAGDAILIRGHLTPYLPLASGILLVAAGLYQFSPLKNLCLKACQSPFDFLMGSWSDGYRGSFRMGVSHGTFCLGCCWLLFLILIPLGLMNLILMALVTILIFAEKTLPNRRISFIAGLLLLVAGGIFIFFPATVQ